MILFLIEQGLILSIGIYSGIRSINAIIIGNFKGKICYSWNFTYSNKIHRMKHFRQIIPVMIAFMTLFNYKIYLNYFNN